MNERMIELYQEASEFAYKICREEGREGGTSDHIWNTLSTGRFAELIVRECTEQVRGQYLPVMEDKEMMKDTHWRGYVQCGVDSVVAIKEHFFGVEE